MGKSYKLHSFSSIFYFNKTNLSFLTIRGGANKHHNVFFVGLIKKLFFEEKFLRGVMCLNTNVLKRVILTCLGEVPQPG